jgi:hypothetical protein
VRQVESEGLLQGKQKGGKRREAKGDIPECHEVKTQSEIFTALVARKREKGDIPNS